MQQRVRSYTSLEPQSLTYVMEFYVNIRRSNEFPTNNAMLFTIMYQLQFSDSRQCGFDLAHHVRIDYYLVVYFVSLFSVGHDKIMYLTLTRDT